MLAKTYNPQDHEDKIYKKWEKSGAFTPEIPSGISSSAKATEGLTGSQAKSVKSPFVIAMPPPNVTGKLHIGHALFVTVQDILTRYHRMRGEPTLWLPGTDHAGIATQNVVEKQLKKEGVVKRDLGREKFVERVWGWKEEYGSEITNQIKKLGASCDWSRERFTLDEGLTKAVNEAFIELYKKGLIYRGLRTVNWCPRCHSAIADDEVEYKKEKGKFYHLKYGPFVLATARPETKLGDTAVAVHPSDKRYKEMVGKKYKIKGVLGDFEIVVVADNSVDPKFGTGAVKVTPAHSLVDFEISQRHNVPLKQVIDENGRMMANTGKYAGMKTKEAREAIVADLQKMGLIEKIEENYEHNIGVCYRCGGVIEPIPSLQWFVKMKPLAEKAKEAVKSSEIKILPKRFEKVYFHWLDNIRDWCISRQLWWGHRIPVYYRNSKLKIKNEKLKVMGVAERVVPQVQKGKTKTYRIRDHEFKVGDKVYFENSATGEIFGYGILTESTKTKVKDLPLQDKAHGAVYSNLDELIEAFKFHNPDKDVTPDTDAYIYSYNFTPAEKFEKFDIDNLKLIENLKFKIENSKDNREIYVGSEPPKDGEWTQDEDVLDTWFSSGLWPFSTLGWPSSAKVTEGEPNVSTKQEIRNSKQIGNSKIENCQQLGLPYAPGMTACDYQYFFPTTVMETGYDILFFWVARMIMMSLELTGQIPFKTVYLHGLVRDEQNRKMSKSLGNVLDPLDVSAKYGTDAVRMSLVVGTTAGNDSKTGESKIKGYRNFSNKIWNIARFVLTNLEESKFKSQMSNKVSNVELSKQDEGDLKRLDEIVEKTTKYLDNFQFSRAGELLYDYTWHEFADKIIEEAKKRLNGDDEQDKVVALFKLNKILLTVLKLLHPFMPFVSEAIWQNINEKLRGEQDLINAPWPANYGK